MAILMYKLIWDLQITSKNLVICTFGIWNYDYLNVQINLGFLKFNLGGIYIVTLYCCIPHENAPQNEASPSVINNSGHVRGLEGSSYISLTAFQISKLFLDVNEHPSLKRVATSIIRK